MNRKWISLRADALSYTTFSEPFSRPKRAHEKMHEVGRLIQLDQLISWRGPLSEHHHGDTLRRAGSHWDALQKSPNTLGAMVSFLNLQHPLVVPHPSQRTFSSEHVIVFHMTPDTSRHVYFNLEKVIDDTKCSIIKRREDLLGSLRVTTRKSTHRVLPHCRFRWHGTQSAGLLANFMWIVWPLCEGTSSYSRRDSRQRLAAKCWSHAGHWKWPRKRSFGYAVASINSRSQP